MASDETSRISGIDYDFRGCSHSLVEPTALWALGLARLQLASVRAGERAEVALAGAPGRVAAAADESGWRTAGLTAGAAAACVGACWHTRGGGTRHGTLRGVAAAADESGLRDAGLTAGAAAACVGVCGLQSEDGRRGCGLHRGVWAREWRWHSPRHHERGCCGGRRKRVARCWPHGRRGCCLRWCVRAVERDSPRHPPMG